MDEARLSNADLMHDFSTDTDSEYNTVLINVKSLRHEKFILKTYERVLVFGKLNAFVCGRNSHDEPTEDSLKQARVPSQQTVVVDQEESQCDIY